MKGSLTSRAPLLGVARDFKFETAENDATYVPGRDLRSAPVPPSYSSLLSDDGDHLCKQQRGRRDQDAESFSSQFSMFKTVFLALVCSIASLSAAIAAYHHSINRTSQLESMLRSTHSHNDLLLHFSDGASSTLSDEPLSYKSPSELGVPFYKDRPEYSRPGSVFGFARNGSQTGTPLPTNEWYLNLLVGLDDSPGPNDEYENFAGEENRVHTIPYIIDTVGPIVGIRMHYPNVLCYGTVVQSAFVSFHGVTLGTADEGFTRRYQVDEASLGSKLGIGLRWDKQNFVRNSQKFMRSSILRGMPYGTMEYGDGVLPTIASEIVAMPPLIDGTTRMQCGSLNPTKNQILDTNSTSILAKGDVELFFPESDHTWVVFFSRPVFVQCYINPKKVMAAVSLPPGAASIREIVNPNAFQLRLDPTRNYGMETNQHLIVRIALANNCTTGSNVNFCYQNRARDQSTFMSALRKHADVYPTFPTVKYSFADPEGGLRPEAPDAKSAYLFFDWAAKSFKDKSTDELIMFALPHHIDILRQLRGQSSNEVIGHCVHSLHGNSCLVKGGLWAMEEVLGGLPNFMSPRPPSHLAIPELAKALSKDIAYSLPENYMQGAGDTYFSGKMLAKLGRIIVIAQELRGFAERPELNQPDTTTPAGEELSRIILKCREATLPTEDEVTDAIARLKGAVEVWLNGSAATLFTYDNTWGGLVSCGCLFNGKGCDNVFPNCPSYSDPGLNFGNGFYNDHHFHYGYHIYAAAIVAQYDRDWGRKHFEQVLLYIRDIANPSTKDVYFPIFRQKDWFLGNSWASGVALFGSRPYLNGRNQESSSEAIAAYEGVAMFGSVMMKAFGNGVSTNQSYNKNAAVACQIFNIGRFLATTEIRSADRYWHVYSPKRHQVYPDSYTPAVVSMMWDTMAQFQTWFGSAPFLAYGIQLMPLTPISERRDSDQWIRQLYPAYVASCESDPMCIKEGWAVMVYAVLATLGHPEAAFEKALAIPESAFVSAGGSGHSLTNTLWYIASRPPPIVPYDLVNPSTSIHSETVPMSEQEEIIDCGCPDTCIIQVLSTNADGFTCKERIQWLMTNRGLNDLGACRQVSGEFQSECGPCNPELCSGPNIAKDTDSEQSGCPPCNKEVCRSDTNRCQIASAPFLCYEGTSMGGCASTPWNLSEDHCLYCCQLFEGCEE